jgi:hypothetical protein
MEFHMPKTKKTVEGSSPKTVVDRSEEKPIESAIQIIKDETPRVLSKKERVEKIKQEELRMVKGRFKFYKCPGGNTWVHLRKYKGVPEFKKLMFDGGVYEVPLYVARFLNGVDAQAGELDRVLHSCSTPVHAWAWPKDQQSPNPGMVFGDTIIPVSSVSNYDQRVGFESLEFGEADMAEATRSA